MSEHKYTPGPWRVDTWNGWLLSKEDVGIVKFDINRTLLADAKLIAAAPELLAVCELIKKWMLGGQPGPLSDSIVLEVIESVIKKAKAEWVVDEQGTVDFRWKAKGK